MLPIILPFFASLIMELIGINKINEEYLFYADMRSVKKYLQNNGFPVIRLGKGEFILKKQWNEFLENTVSLQNRSIDEKPRDKRQRREDYRFSSEAEEKIYNELMRKINA